MAKNLQSELGLFTVDSNTRDVTLTGAASDVDFVAERLGRESGLMGQQLRNMNAIRMANDPDGQYTAYMNDMTDSIKAIAPTWQSDFSSLIAAGLSEEEAKSYADNAAKISLSTRAPILNLKYPFANDIDMLASAAAKAGTQFHVPGGKANTDVDSRKQWKNEYKAKRKAKKNKSKQ